MVKYLVYAITTDFGSTGEDEFGFIQEPYLLIARKQDNKFIETFSKIRVFLTNTEKIRWFRTRENAQRWIETHKVTINGQKPSSFVIRTHYGEI